MVKEDKYNMQDGHIGSVEDTEKFNKLVNGEVRKQGSISKLGKIEELIKKHCPYRLSYDVNRPQGMLFDEFGFTEVLGSALYVYPMNTELATKVVFGAACGNGTKNDILNKCSIADKYSNLEPLNFERYPKTVVILPGSNLLWEQTSKELLFRVMHENSDAVIKPHPLTEQEDARALKLEFGISRLICKNKSGMELVINCDTMYTTSTSELGIYGHLLGKNVYTVANFFNEHNGTYYPLYLLGRLDQEGLFKSLCNPMSGVFFEDTTEEEIKNYFDNIMRMRMLHAPISSSRFTKGE